MRKPETPDSTLWYDDWRGEVVVAGFVLVTLLGALISINRLRPAMKILPPLVVSVPIDIYLFGFLGAVTWTMFAFGTTVIPNEDGKDKTGKRPFVFTREIKRTTLRTFAALCLAVGVFLSSHLLAESVEFVGTPLPQLQAGGAFVVGFYVERAYDALGNLADRILDLLKPERREPEFEILEQLSEAITTPSESSSQELIWAWTLVGGGIVTVSVAVLLSVNWGTPPPSVLTPFVPFFPTSTIPFAVYLYAFLGSMGYVFTSLFHEFDRSLQSLLSHTLRIPAGPLLAGGLYLFTALIIPPAGEFSLEVSEGVAGLAFLFGLYTNVALVMLDVIVTRVFAPFTRDNK